MTFSIKSIIYFGLNVVVSFNKQRTRKTSYVPQQASIIDKIIDKLRPKVFIESLSEEDEMLDYLQHKPWRAPKVRNLKVQYR